MTADDRRIGADRRAAFHQCRPELILALDFGARVVDIGEDAGRTAKDAILERHAFVERHVVLDLAAIADRDVRACHDILPERAIAADARVRQDMHEMPDARSRTDLARLVDKGGGMNFRAGMSRR